MSTCSGTHTSVPWLLPFSLPGMPSPLLSIFSFYFVKLSSVFLYRSNKIALLPQSLLWFPKLQSRDLAFLICVLLWYLELPVCIFHYTHYTPPPLRKTLCPLRAENIYFPWFHIASQTTSGLFTYVHPSPTNHWLIWVFLYLAPSSLLGT